MEDKWETSVNSCAPSHPEWETRVGDEWETSVNSCGPSHPEWETSVGDKGETSVNSCGPRNPEWETSVEDKCGRHLSGTLVSQTSVPIWKQVLQDTQSGRQVWETSCKLKRSQVPHSCGPSHPQWETSLGRQVGDKCK